MHPETHLALNSRAAALAQTMIADAESLRIGVSTGALGETLIDCGIRCPGGTEAGLRLAEICLAGLAEVTLVPSRPGIHLPWSVRVETHSPALACLASQYAGWHFEGTAEDVAFSVLGSGPARALACREPLFEDIGYRDTADSAVLVLETETIPPSAITADAADACGLAPEQLILLFAPTTSAAGSVQVAARSVECALQKARLRDFPLDRIRSAVGVAPLCPPHPDKTAAMGRTNDAIIYGGHVALSVAGPADEAERLARQLPSRTSSEWGRSFAEVFADCGGDFRAIDAEFFSPAEVAVTALESDETFRAGQIEPGLLQKFVA